MALVVAEAVDGDFGVFLPEDVREFFTPLDEEDGALVTDEIVEAEGVEFAGTLEAVEIDVIDVAGGAAIFVDEGEGGAGDVVGVGGLEARGDSLGQGGFTGAEIATEKNNACGGKFEGETAA